MKRHRALRRLPAHRQPYLMRVLNTRRGNLVAYWPLAELSGSTAYDLSPQGNHGVYAGAGVSLGAVGIGDGRAAAQFDGSDTRVQTGSPAFAADWDGDLFSLIAWGVVDGAARWTDAATYRYLIHIRSSLDGTYYTVIGKNTANHQLEWRRRTGGAIVSTTHTFNPSGPLGWFCMGMTFDITGSEILGPLLKFFLNDRVDGWRVLGESNSAALTAWGANPPDNPSTTLLGAGSSTLQEWIGCIAHAAVWNAALSEGEMRRVMTLGE